VDNDGNPLLTGALYWNTVSNEMFVWSGSAWGGISSTAQIFRYRYTAAGGETSESGPDDNGVTLSYLPGKEQVYLNGVLLVRSQDYTATNGTSITSLSPALVSGDVLEIITFTAFDIATAIPNSILDAKGDLIVATSADTPGKLSVGANGTLLVADSSTATGLAWSNVISANTSANALEIRQIGTGNALVVEDDTNPDASPFVITSAGSVGIATSTPLRALDINGGIALTVAGGGSRSINGINSTTGVAPIAIQFESGASPFLLFMTNASTSAASERMRIDSAGNVNIGPNGSVAAGGTNTQGLSINGHDVQLMTIMGAWI
jgi:hypothetical protein